MGEPTSRMDAEVHADELLAHAGWLHGLAARLVRDPERAADVVQDTWLVALERPPRGRGAALRRWLGAVARNLARRASVLQSGYLYHYAFAMLIGVVALISFYLFLSLG